MTSAISAINSASSAPSAAKKKFPRALAISAAKTICDFLSPVTHRLIVAGSLRRRKPDVGDIEILYIPRKEIIKDPRDLFASKEVNLADEAIMLMLSTSGPTGEVLRSRPNKDGHTTWGEKNKLAIHVPSGIPVDLFATTEQAWWNYLVCRTGSADNNIRISNAALAKGWHWHPYRSGFTDDRGRWHHATSEQQVFALAGLEYLEPWER